MKRVLHIQLLPLLSGVQRVSLQLFAGLPQDNYEFSLLCAPPQGDGPSLVSEAEKLGVRVYTLPGLRRELGLRDVTVLPRLVRFLRQHRFDVVHTHSSKTGVLGRIAARLAGVPCIVHTVHGIAFHRNESFPKRLFYWLAECAAGMCTHRLVLVNQCYQRYYTFVPAARRTTVYNAIDYAKVIPRQQREDDEFRVLFVNRFEPQKDPLAFLQAVHWALRREPRIRARMVGEGRLRPVLERYILRYGLQDRVLLSGWSNDVPALMAAGDLFCTTSRWEAFGLVHLEAAAAGVPVVATAVEGVPEVVRHNETGLLVPPDDPTALSEAMVKLARNPQLCRKLGEQAAERVPGRFPMERFLHQYHNIYMNCGRETR